MTGRVKLKLATMFIGEEQRILVTPTSGHERFLFTSRVSPRDSDKSAGVAGHEICVNLAG